MGDTFPAKSKVLYLAAYSDFERFLKSEKRFVPDVVPSEMSLLNYFSYLKLKKHLLQQQYGVTTVELML
jgi:hypothetical protein